MQTATSVLTLVKQLRSRANSNPFVIAIGGFGGSGKSTLSDSLVQTLGNCIIIRIDDFIQLDKNGALPGYPHDWSLIENEVLSRIKMQDEVRSRSYDWQSNKPVNETLIVRDFIVIDGMLPVNLIKYVDVTIWIDCSLEIASARGKKRDREEQGIDHDELWDTVWTPKAKAFYDTYRPDLTAGIIYKGSQ